MDHGHSFQSQDLNVRNIPNSHTWSTGHWWGKSTYFVIRSAFVCRRFGLKINQILNGCDIRRNHSGELWKIFILNVHTTIRHKITVQTSIHIGNEKMGGGTDSRYPSYTCTLSHYTSTSSISGIMHFHKGIVSLVLGCWSRYSARIWRRCIIKFDVAIKIGHALSAWNHSVWLWRHDRIAHDIHFWKMHVLCSQCMALFRKSLEFGAEIEHQCRLLINPLLETRDLFRNHLSVLSVFHCFEKQVFSSSLFCVYHESDHSEKREFN